MEVPGSPHPGAGPATTDPAVRVQGLSRTFGARSAVDGVDLELARGEFLTVFGPNGAGKTTLIKMLAHLARPTRGEVEIFGRALKGETGEEARGLMGLVGHATFVYAGLTARENLEFYARMYGVADPRGRATELLEQMGLLDREDDTVGTFSRGMQQRLSIARALVHDPDLLLLDEPYTGLDPHAAELLSERLRGIHQRGKTVVMTSHDLALGRSLSTRFLVLVRGKVVLDGRPDEIAADELARIYRKRVEERG